MALSLRLIRQTAASRHNWPLPAIGLQDARERARRYTEIVAKGVSPVADAKKGRGAVKALDSVRAFVEYWYEAEIANKSESYRKITRRALDKDIFPSIGDKVLRRVDAGDALAIWLFRV